jgi:hypothetical protein
MFLGEPPFEHRRLASHLVVSRRIALQSIASLHCIALHRLASHHTIASRRIASSHCLATLFHCIASHRNALHRVLSPRPHLPFSCSSLSASVA